MSGQPLEVVEMMAVAGASGQRRQKKRREKGGRAVALAKSLNGGSLESLLRVSIYHKVTGGEPKKTKKIRLYSSSENHFEVVPKRL